MRLLAAVMALGLAAMLAAPPAAANPFEAMTVEEREAFRAELRAYLLENPEVLEEAIAVLEERRAQLQAEADIALVTANAEALFEDAGSWVGGNPEGDITVVEFIDYRCGYCRRAYQEVEELVATDGNIRFIDPAQMERIRRRDLAHGRHRLPAARTGRAAPRWPSWIGRAYDKVSEGQTLLIVEAMKTMNQIPAPRAGHGQAHPVEDKSPWNTAHR
jgi:hypothetical protein